MSYDFRLNFYWTDFDKMPQCARAIIRLLVHPQKILSILVKPITGDN